MEVLARFDVPDANASAAACSRDWGYVNRPRDAALDFARGTIPFNAESAEQQQQSILGALRVLRAPR